MTLFGRALSYGGVSLPVAAVGTHLQGGLPAGATAAVALLGVAMLAGRAHLVGVLPQLGPRSRKAAAPALALLLVGSLALSGAGPAPVESASAETVNVTCPYGDVLSWFGISNDQCSGPVSSAPDTSTAENKVEIYQDAGEVKAWSETITTQTNNSLTNLQTTLYASGQAVQIHAIQNGSSVAQVNLKVNKSIDERVSKMQVNQINAWNQRIQSIKNIAEAQSVNDVTIAYLGTASNSDTWAHLDPTQFTNRSVTLSNGTEMTVKAIGWTHSEGESGHFDPDNETQFDKRALWTIDSIAHGKITTSGDYYNASYINIFVQSVNGKSKLSLYSEPQMAANQNWITLQKKAQLAKENLAASTPTLVEKRENGTLNVSNVINPSTLWQEYSTRYGETGNLALARATAAAAGYATPSLENVSVMNVTHDGLTYTGALFSQSAPDNGTWVLNRTYDAANISGAQLVATTGGQMVELDGAFTVSAIKNGQGETLNQTSVRNYRYETANVTQLIELQQQLNELRQEVASQTASGGGGGGGGGGSSPAIVAGLGITAVLAVVYLQKRDT